MVESNIDVSKLTGSQIVKLRNGSEVELSSVSRGLYTEQWRVRGHFRSDLNLVYIVTLSRKGLTLEQPVDNQKRNPDYDIVEVLGSRVTLNLDAIQKGVSLTLSDNSAHVVLGRNPSGIASQGYANLRFETIAFEDGYSLNQVQTNGVVRGSNLRIVSIGLSETEERPVDMSSLQLGDVCITRTGREIPWDKIADTEIEINDEGLCLPFVYIFGSQAIFVDSNGWHNPDHRPSDDDIVSIRRASKEERAAILKSLAD